MLQNPIEAIVESNRTRKDFVADQVLSRVSQLVYSGTPAPVVVYEPMLDAPDFFGSEVTHDLEFYKRRCDVIAVSRWSDDFADVAGKVYARDLFKRD